MNAEQLLGGNFSPDEKRFPAPDPPHRDPPGPRAPPTSSSSDRPPPLPSIKTNPPQPPAQTPPPFSPPPNRKNKTFPKHPPRTAQHNCWVWAFCAHLAQIFFVFFSGFHLPEGWNVPTDFFVRNFLHRFLVCRYLCRFACMFCAVFGAKRKVGVPESRNNAHKICRNIYDVTMALPGWVPYSSSAFLSRQHVTQSSPGPSDLVLKESL